MATAQIKLPPGFVLDKSEEEMQAPEGFVLDVPRETAKPGFAQTIQGAAQAGLSLGSQMLAAPAAGAASWYGWATSPESGAPAWQRAAELRDKTQEALTYRPRIEGAQKAADIISWLPSKLSEFADYAGDVWLERTGSPTVATGVNVAINALPMMLGRVGKPVVQAAKQRAAANLGPPGVKEAMEAGYRLTPMQRGAGMPLSNVEGIAGSAKLEKMASLENQANTNRLIAEDLGIPEVTPGALENIRRQAGTSYEAVKKSVKLIKPDARFRQDLADLRGDLTNAAKEYPDLLKNAEVEALITGLDKTASPVAMVELTRSLRKKAKDNYKAFDNPEKRELAQAQRGAADAIESMIDRALMSVGKGGLVKDWQKARTTIAKTYDVEAALNDVTGDVSARQLGLMLKRGKPLTGNLEKVAKFGRAFEGSARDPAKMRDATQSSAFDYMMGVGGAAVGGGAPLSWALGGLGLVGRPLVRRSLLRGKTPGSPGLALRLSDLATQNPYAFAVAPALGLRPLQEEE